METIRKKLNKLFDLSLTAGHSETKRISLNFHSQLSSVSLTVYKASDNTPIFGESLYYDEMLEKMPMIEKRLDRWIELLQGISNDIKIK